MTQTIRVTLDTTVTPHVLSVHDNGSIKVKRNDDPEVIRWVLKENLKDGAFPSSTDSNPGFTWVDTPPAGLFVGPIIAPNGKSLIVIDNHLGGSSDGEWIYRLRVKLGDDTYETTTSLKGQLTSKNPIIIND